MRLGPIARNRERHDEAIRARSHTEDRSAIHLWHRSTEGTSLRRRSTRSPRAHAADPRRRPCARPAHRLLRNLPARDSTTPSLPLRALQCARRVFVQMLPDLPILASPVQGYLSQNTRPKKPGARPWMRHTLVHNGRRVSRDRVRYATSRLDETRAVVRFEHH